MQVGGDMVLIFIFESDRKEKTLTGESSSTTSSSVVARHPSSPSPPMDNTTSTSESFKAELREGDNKVTRVPDDLEFLMNFYSTTPTSSPIELQPAWLFCQEVISTGAHTDAAAPAAQTTALAQTESACLVKKGSGSASKGKSRKGNRANKINQRPCSDCQRQQKKCAVVQNEPRLCFHCQKKGKERCPPWASRKGKGKRKPSGTYTPHENTPGCGTLSFN
ncbi:hypothetical protein ACEPAI_5477 [Sanghuangporus weigelae]